MLNDENGTVAEPLTGELVEPTLNREQAEAITAEINDTSERLSRLVVAAYRGRVWIPLGLGSWEAYADAELKRSRSAVYRLQAQGEVELALSAAAGLDVSVQQRDAAVVRRAGLTDVEEFVRRSVGRGTPPQEAVNRAVADARAAVSSGNNRRPDGKLSRSATTPAVAPVAQDDGPPDPLEPHAPSRVGEPDPQPVEPVGQQAFEGSDEWGRVETEPVSSLAKLGLPALRDLARRNREMARKLAAAQDIAQRNAPAGATRPRPSPAGEPREANTQFRDKKKQRL